MASPNREIWKRAWVGWTGGNWLARSIFMSVAGALGVYFVGPLMTPPYSILVAGAIGGILAAVLWAVITFLVSLFRAPGKLLRERDAVIAGLNATIEQLRSELAALVERAAAEKELVPVFTSEGLNWQPIGEAGGGVKDLFITMIRILADGKTGLPQPLLIRITTSREPRDAYAAFHHRKFDVNSKGGELVTRIDGRYVFITLSSPKLFPENCVSATLQSPEGAIEIDLVERQKLA
jgi:hypothetical protein